MKEVDRKVEKTLSAFDGIKRATAPDDFEKVLFQKIRFVPQWIKWFQYSAAALILFGIMNVLTALYISTDFTETDYMEEDLLTEPYYPIITISEE